MNQWDFTICELHFVGIVIITVSRATVGKKFWCNANMTQSTVRYEKGGEVLMRKTKREGVQRLN